MSDHAPLPDTVTELHALVLEQQASIEEQQASFVAAPVFLDTDLG
ncbi:MAG: hypothetical protein VB142_06270 [Burkholderia sp.]